MAGETAPRYGIYFNAGTNRVVRITTRYWLPEPPEWTFLTDEVNAPLTDLRELVKEQGLSSHAEDLRWGAIPDHG